MLAGNESNRPEEPSHYYLWGAGSVGRRALEYLKPLSVLNGIIDTDPAKQGQELSGLKVTDYDSLMPLLKESGVIIAHFQSKETEEILKRDKIKYWRLSEFIAEWYWLRRKQHAIGFLDFPITTRCSLNCRNCMQYIPYRSNLDVPLETLKQDLETLFRHVSFVGEVSIIGGEPFLHKQLPELLKHIGRNYRGRIGSLVITTNGTVIPDFRVLESCNETEVFISISDYSKTLPQIRQKIAMLERKARDHHVKIERKLWAWTNPGQFNIPVSDLEDCPQMHMQLTADKLWRCTLMAAGHEANFCAADSGLDYYDLTQENSNTLQSFLKGNKQPRRTSQCRNCLFSKGIVAITAEQI